MPLNNNESDSNNNYYHPSVRLVLPHYNSLDLLKDYLPKLLDQLKTDDIQAEVIVVDDGSLEAIQTELQTLESKWKAQSTGFAKVILLKKNFGKGYAIRSGWNPVLGNPSLLAFVDADGSVPATAVSDQLQKALQSPDELRCAVRPTPSKETRSLKRRLMGITFSMLTHRLLGITVSDPQCGFKIVPTAIYRELETTYNINRFAFDCELLTSMKAAGVTIIEDEVPWAESPTSTVNALRDGLAMFRDVIRIRLES